MVRFVVNRLLNALGVAAVAEGYRMRAKQQAHRTLKAAYSNLDTSLKDPALRKRLLADSTLNAEVRIPSQSQDYMAATRST